MITRLRVIISDNNCSTSMVFSLYCSNIPCCSPPTIYCLLQLPPTSIVMQTSAQSTKEACVRCSPTPITHLSALTPAKLFPLVWLMCSICWMIDWQGQGKSSHTFPVHMAGRPVWPCWAAQGPPPKCHCWLLPLLCVPQFVPSFKASHASVVVMP